MNRRATVDARLGVVTARGGDLVAGTIEVTKTEAADVVRQDRAVHESRRAELSRFVVQTETVQRVGRIVEVQSDIADRYSLDGSIPH